MSLVVLCECGKKLKAKDELAGKRVKCPACHKVLQIPAGRRSDSSVGAPANALSPSSAPQGSDLPLPQQQQQQPLPQQPLVDPLFAQPTVQPATPAAWAQSPAGAPYSAYSPVSYSQPGPQEKPANSGLNAVLLALGISIGVGTVLVGVFVTIYLTSAKKKKNQQQVAERSVSSASIEQASRQASGAAPISASESSIASRAQGRPLSDDECRQFALRLQEAVLLGHQDVTAYMIDWDWIFV